LSLAYDPTSIFGRIVSGDDVEQWCVDLFVRWMGTYLSEVERQHGLTAGSWARPRTFRRSLSLDKWPEDQLPAVVLVSTGLATPPVKAGDGKFRARWLMGLVVICSARTEELSHDMARHYCAAIRTLLEQRPSLDGYADGVQWLDESYNDLNFDDSRSLCTGRAVFAVEVDDVMSANSGPVTPDDPLSPDTDPWAPWPTVETVEIVVEQTDDPSQTTKGEA
jgi:hypothetical protein